MDAHKTPLPEDFECHGAALRESARIEFVRTTLNGVDLFAADITNVFLQTPASEMCCIVCRIDFMLENAEKRSIDHRESCSGKASRKGFRNCLRPCMSHLDFAPFFANPHA